MTKAERIGIIVCVILLGMIQGLRGYNYLQYKKTIKTIKTIDSQKVLMFRIYPRVIEPVGIPIEFTTPDPLIQEFFQAFTDLKSYEPTHDTVHSRDHSWFLEFSNKNATIQIEFLIPSGKGTIVAGNPNGYGWFQSQNLYHWYQTYSHRWLTPENDRDSE